MNQNMKDLAIKSGLVYAVGNGLFYEPMEDSDVTTLLEIFMESVVAVCTESVRGVLRETDNNLSHGDAALIQARIKEATGVSW